MNFDEQTAKELLEARGIRIPRGRVATTAEEAAAVARELGTPVVIKPLLPTGRRGKTGLIRFAEDARAAFAEAAELLTSSLIATAVSARVAAPSVSVVLAPGCSPRAGQSGRDRSRHRCPRSVATASRTGEQGRKIAHRT